MRHRNRKTSDLSGRWHRNAYKTSLTSRQRNTPSQHQRFPHVPRNIRHRNYRPIPFENGLGYPIRMPNPANPIPPGFHTLTMHLTVKKGAAAYIDFLKRAFNAVEIRRSPGPDGKLMHADVRVGDSILMLNDDFSAEFGLEPLAEGKSPLYIHHYSADADAAWKQAIEAGCEVTMPISDQFWGDRYGHVRDPFGFNWAIASRKEELTPEEIEVSAAKAFAQGHP